MGQINKDYLFFPQIGDCDNRDQVDGFNAAMPAMNLLF